MLVAKYVVYVKVDNLKETAGFYLDYPDGDRWDAYRENGWDTLEETIAAIYEDFNSYMVRELIICMEPRYA